MSTFIPTRRSFLKDAIQRFSQNRLALLGLFLVGFILFLALFADLLSPFAYDHAYFDRVLLMPFEHSGHPLGTDEVGRDYLSRLIYGARTSMMVSLSVQMIALLIGLPIGALAGYFGGAFDFVISS